MQQTKTMAEMLAPILTERGLKVTIPSDFDSDAIFVGIPDVDGTVALILNPKHNTTRNPEQFDFSKLLKPDMTESMMGRLKLTASDQVKFPAWQNYLNLRKSRF